MPPDRGGGGRLERAELSALTRSMASQFLNEMRSREEGVSVEDYAARVQQTIPLGRYGEPGEIGNVVAFLCSERASYVTGVSLQVDGGVIQSTF